LTGQSPAIPGVGSLRPLRVQNLESNMSVFAKTVNGDPTFRVTFQANGHAGDTQRVPIDLANDIDFLNALEAGVLKVLDGPAEVVEALQFETKQIAEDRKADAARHTEVLDRRQDRDMIGAKCIGPRGAGREGTCDRALVRSAKSDTPPLCTDHAHLAPTFHLVETGSKGEGATESRDGVVRREWRQAQMTEPQRQAQ
jgi:hypothetical protein